jgi:hypothetical protein
VRYLANEAIRFAESERKGLRGGQRFPGVPSLAKRWGWTEYRVREFLRREAWKHPEFPVPYDVLRPSRAVVSRGGETKSEVPPSDVARSGDESADAETGFARSSRGGHEVATRSSQGGEAKADVPPSGAERSSQGGHEVVARSSPHARSSQTDQPGQQSVVDADRARDPQDRMSSVGEVVRHPHRKDAAIMAGSRHAEIEACRELSAGVGLALARDDERAIVSSAWSVEQLRLVWDFLRLAPDRVAELAREGPDPWGLRWRSILKPGKADERLARAVAWDRAGRQTGPPARAAPPSKPGRVTAADHFNDALSALKDAAGAD